MRKSGQVELQSSGWLQQHTADRPSFAALIHRRPFQVFALPTGLLFLELRNKPGSGSGPSGAVVAGAVLGGAIGALVGAAVASSMTGPAEHETGFDMCDEEQLFDLAASRKRSFVAKQDEIRSISIDVPGFFGRMQNLVGQITLRDCTLGKVRMAIHDASAMSVAVDALPRRFGDRVQVNVELEQRNMRFVPLRA